MSVFLFRYQCVNSLRPNGPISLSVIKAILGLDNGLTPVQHQATTQTNAGYIKWTEQISMKT